MVGLGNPGVEYQNTRHNLGFMVVDSLARRTAPGAVARGKFHGHVIETHLDGEKLVLLRPTTFMNRSGISVAEAVNFYKLDPSDDLLVITDDVALATGAIRLRASGSAGGHNGLTDIEGRLGTDAYARLRMGIGAPGNIPQKSFVLGQITEDERQLFETAIDQAAQAALCWAHEGVSKAMNQYNRRGVGALPDKDDEPSTTDSTSEVRN